MKYASILVLLVLLVFCQLLAAEPLQNLLSFLDDSDLETLLETGELVRFKEGAPDFMLMPESGLAAQIMAEFENYRPNVNNEALFLLPAVKTENPLLYIHNRLRQVSTLSGILYHSNHYREWKVLFDNVYRTAEQGSRKAIEEDLRTFLPQEERMVIHLEDVNFGSSYYEVTFFGSTDNTSFGLQNLTNLRYGPIPVIFSGNVRFQMLLFPGDEYLLVYGVCAVRAGSIIQSRIHLPSSFYTRMRALRDWFKQEIYQSDN